MAKIIGIDLGTTNSCVAVMEGNDPVVIPNSEGHRTTPSCVAFLKDGKRVVGAVAKRQAIANPDRTVLSIKRFMGRRFAEVPEETKIVSYKVVPASNDDCRVEIGDKQYSPPEISAMILQKMRETAEDYLGERVSKAVITVPAYFNDSQRQATKDAGRIAGLEVERIINEPTAAALAYGLDKKKNEKVAVFDLGGGTFDISILEIGEEGVFQVLSTNGDTHLGGDDFDERIMHWLADGFQAQYGIDLRQDKFALQRLKEAAEKAKCELSQLSETAIREMYVTADASGPKHIDVTLTRAKLEELVASLIERTVGPCQQALKDANLAPAQVDEVILVGGMSRMPAVQNKVRQIFGKDPNKSVNPDEVVAIGAAIQGGILGGQVKDILLLDVTPLSLGIETLGGISTKLIDRNTTIPTRKSQVFTTADHNQTTVEIHVLQGEREMAAYNRTIGRFHLDGIPPALQGVPQIEVTFDIDANGILNVSAKDLATGNQQHITITASSGLADAEIDKMVKEAKEHADDDKRMREEAEVKNRAASAVFQSEKLIKDLGDKVTAEEKNKIEAAIAHLKDVKEKGNTAEIRSATEALETALNEMSTRLYQQAGPQGGAYTPPPGGEGPAGGGPGPEQPGPGGGGDQGDVVDADYEIIDDDGKK